MTNPMLEILSVRTGIPGHVLNKHWLECKNELLESSALEDEDFFDKVLHRFKEKVGIPNTGKAPAKPAPSPEKQIIGKIRDIRA